ncbi:hypothetical protein TIFTF001_006170 [Ficus carica]|uniref:Protein PYRICULARIA ORYZAE RESISTANCE 21-like n=1 Tax=Ficus carica TaxID=3494 RepID=A0AA87ZQI0_FICCA|nr:hypothetical protein TIFTF001_006170 [Ficus carica]
MAHVTTMVLKADLQCCKCYKKVKEVLCRFDQIQDQVYDEKNNTVTIKVICCDLEKMKHKIICKGKGVIKCIEIKVPAKTKEEQAKPPKDGQVKQTDKVKPNDQPTAKPPPPRPVPVPVPCVPCVPVCPVPPPFGTFRRTCCSECYEGRGGGPCFHGHTIGGPPPCYSYDGHWGWPVCDSYGGWKL